MEDLYTRIQNAGLELPEAPPAAGRLVPAIQGGQLIISSGQTATKNGRMYSPGKLGDYYTIEMGKESARDAALNCLASIEWLIKDLNLIHRMVKVTGYVASAPAFTSQPSVIDGASEVLQTIFGKDQGAHARTAIGVAELPLGAPVELEIVATLSKTEVNS